MRKVTLALAAAATVTGCSVLQPRDGSADRKVDVFMNGKPQKPFSTLSEIDLYVEKPSRGPATPDEFMPALEKRARAAGADAVYDVRWELRGGQDVGIYRVHATAASYDKPGAAAAAKNPPPPSPPASPAAALPAQPAAQGPPILSAVDAQDIEVFASGRPARPFTTVSRLDLYVEKRTPGDPSSDDVMPELKRQARLSGAEAVVDVHWSLQSRPSGGVYHVTATGIAYSAPTAPGPR